METKDKKDTRTGLGLYDGVTTLKDFFNVLLIKRGIRRSVLRRVTKCNDSTITRWRSGQTNTMYGDGRKLLIGWLRHEGYTEDADALERITAQRDTTTQTPQEISTSQERDEAQGNNEDTDRQNKSDILIPEYKGVAPGEKDACTEANRTRLPAILYNRQDVDTFTSYFPSEEDINIEMLLPAYGGEHGNVAGAYREVFGQLSPLELRQAMQRHAFYMKEAAKMGLPKEFFSNNSLYFKKVPSSMEGIPEDLWKKIFHTRYNALVLRNYDADATVANDVQAERLDKLFTFLYGTGKHAWKMDEDELMNVPGVDKKILRKAKNSGDDDLLKGILIDAREAFKERVFGSFGIRDSYAYMSPFMGPALKEWWEVDARALSIKYYLALTRAGKEYAEFLKGKRNSFTPANDDSDDELYAVGETQKYTASTSEASTNGPNLSMEVPVGGKMWRATMVGPCKTAGDGTVIWDQNILLAEGIKLSTAPMDIRKNLNMLVIGGGGSGKTHGCLKPNIMQGNASFVVTGNLYDFTDMIPALTKKGYTIKIISPLEEDYNRRCHYNPLDYVYDKEGNVDKAKVSGVANTIIMNSDKRDPFWQRAAEAWLMFAILFITEFFPMEERNLATVLQLAQKGREQASTEAELESMVEEKRKENPGAKCFSFYDTFNLAPAKTRNDTLISVIALVDGFSTDNMKDIATTSYLREGDKILRDKNGDPIKDSSNIDIETINDTKMCVFINTPSFTDKAYECLMALFIQQVIDKVYNKNRESAKKTGYRVEDASGSPLSSTYRSKEEAEEVKVLYEEAYIDEIQDDGSNRYCICNNRADAKFCVQGEPGVLVKTSSREEAKQMITAYKNAVIVCCSTQLPVRLVLDEFCNVGMIPRFEHLMATMRSQNHLSVTICIQSITQLQRRYPEVWPWIVANCDSIIFMGSSEFATCNFISEMSVTRTVHRGLYKKPSPTFSPNEVSHLDHSKCIIIVRDFKPVVADKIDPQKLS